MISKIPVVDRSPEDMTSDTEQQYSEESDDDESGDEEESDVGESSMEGEEAESSPSYEAPKEPRSKELHDPKGKASGAQQPTVSGRATQSSKRARAKAENSVEKQPKLPK